MVQFIKSWLTFYSVSFLSLNFNILRETFESISKAAEAFLFSYLGLSAFYYSKDPWSLSFILLVVLILGLSRIGGCILLYGFVA